MGVGVQGGGGLLGARRGRSSRPAGSHHNNDTSATTSFVSGKRADGGKIKIAEITLLTENVQYEIENTDRRLQCLRI
ncbi:hypothetical protein E2C01_031842 [Portunus trituberculatus]|uniref:Uncharacterized protein n=1 Tax=Portunus trituberculatus TaxID=210409 RepID=A0A5B7EYR4_PORTR|nr:hypothetical protein [Portunus trituberculatus]